MPDEVRATLKLYLDGKIQQWYSRSDGRGVIFILNCTTAAEAKAHHRPAAAVESEPRDVRVHAALAARAAADAAPAVKRGTTNAHAAPPALAEIACACATARQVARAVDPALRRLARRRPGCEAPQFALLMTLDAHGAVSQAVLGRRYALDKTTMSRNLKLFERKA